MSSESKFVSHLYKMARIYDSEILLNLATKMNKNIMERSENEKGLVRMETLERSSPTRIR